MVILLFSTIFIIFFILNASAAIPETAEALRVFLFVVLPSIFPLCVLSDWLVRTGSFTYPGKICTPIIRPIFRLSGICVLPILIGLVGSYPSSAKTTATLYKSGQITLDEAIVLTTFTNNAGPMFVITVIGMKFLASPLLGFVIWSCQILAGFIVGIIFSRIIIKRLLPRKTLGTISLPFRNSIRLLSTSIADAAHTMVTIGGTIIFFTALCTSFEWINIPFVKATTSVLKMLLEMTSGCQSIATLSQSIIYKSCLYAGVISWGGISVHLQIMYILSNDGLPCKPYILGKILHTLLSIFLTYLTIYFII